MLFAVHNQHVSRTFFGSIILAVSILNSQASFLGLDPQAFQYLDPSTLGFLQAMEDLEQMKAPERIPDAWDLNYESYAIPAEPFGPPVYVWTKTLIAEKTKKRLEKTYNFQYNNYSFYLFEHLETALDYLKTAPAKLFYVSILCLSFSTISSS